MSAREYAETADPQSLSWRCGKPRAYSLLGRLLMGRERFISGQDG
jgi:hypothetical protein